MRKQSNGDQAAKSTAEPARLICVVMTNKQSAVLLFCAVLLVCGVRSAKHDISDIDGFVEWANNNNFNPHDDVVLSGDLDFIKNEQASSLLPIGQTDSSCTAFKGTFDGQNYTIRNANVPAKGSYIGLFCALAQGAVVQNVVFDASCSFGNTQDSTGINAGAVAGQVSVGGATLLNVHNHANVVGRVVGGLIGHVQIFNQDDTVTIEQCNNSGNITTTADGTIVSSTGAGGLVGRIAFSSPNTVFVRNSMNTGTVDGGEVASAGGLVGGDSSIDSMLSLNIENSINKGSVCGFSAHGIAPNVTNATNVVNMGTLNFTLETGSRIVKNLW